MAARRCILCGADGPLTREHIWPDWYSKLRPDRTYELESIIDDRRPPEYRKARSLDLQPRVLCAQCNNKWGKALEEAVRPRLGRMAQGSAEIVTLPFARQLAAWAMLKIMAAEHLVRSRNRVPFFRPEHGSYLRSNTKPPEQMFLWIGHYIGGRRMAGWILSKRSWGRLPADESVGVDRYSVTYSLGEVAFQFLGINVFPLTEGQDPNRSVGVFNPFHIQAPWSKALTRIWPLPDSMFSWPSAKTLDHRAFEASAARWHEESPARKVKHQSSSRSKPSRQRSSGTGRTTR